MTAAPEQHALREALATWVERRFPVSRWQAEAHAQAMLSASGPLTSLIAERDAAVADQRAMLIQVGEHARARGEAEGRLQASEIAGIVEGWRARALAAEAEITRLKEGIEAMRAALMPFAKAADIADDDCLKCFASLRYMDEQEIDPILPSGETPVLATLGDLRRARSVLTTIPPKENHDA